MTTITTIIRYPPRTPRALTQRERRARARDQGRCGTCVTAAVEPGYRTCADCRASTARYRKPDRKH